MHFTGQVYRPPLEAYTPLLEVTYGCSHNKCVYCTMYDKTPFGISPVEDIEEDLIELSKSPLRRLKPMDRIYLINGDPFVLSPERLLEISDLIHKYIPEIKTITAYCSFYNLVNKSIDDLKALRDAGYNELWFGVETGYDKALEMINKGIDLDGYIEGLDKMREAGIDYHAIVMAGVAGSGEGEINAIETAKILDYYPPVGIYIMSTSVAEGSELYNMIKRGEFKEATNRENLEEQITLLENLDVPDDTVFSTMHMVNQVHFHEYMDYKDVMIEALKDAIENMDDKILDATNNKIAR